MTLPIFRSEWIVASRRLRLMAFNVLIPLILVAPIALSAAPAAHAAAVFAVLFGLFGTFGSSIPLIRDADSGLLARYALTGAAPGGVVVQRVLASSSLDILELAPSVLLIIIVGNGSATQAATLVGATVVALVAANVLGALAAAVARTVAEGALFSAVSALWLLHLAGTFRTPMPGTWAATAETWIPFHPLHGALLGVTGDAGPTRATSGLAISALITLCGLLAVWALGRYVTAPRRR